MAFSRKPRSHMSSKCWSGCGRTGASAIPDRKRVQQQQETQFDPPRSIRPCKKRISCASTIDAGDLHEFRSAAAEFSRRTCAVAATRHTVGCYLHINKGWRVIHSCDQLDCGMSVN